MLSKCHKKELFKAPLWSGRERLGSVWFCPECESVLGYQGLFCWEGWEMRQGTQGYGCYYRGKGLTKRQKQVLEASRRQVSPHKAPNHGLARIDALKANAFIEEID